MSILVDIEACKVHSLNINQAMIMNYFYNPKAVEDVEQYIDFNDKDIQGLLNRGILFPKEVISSKTIRGKYDINKNLQIILSYGKSGFDEFWNMYPNIKLAEGKKTPLKSQKDKVQAQYMRITCSNKDLEDTVKRELIEYLREHSIYDKFLCSCLGWINKYSLETIQELSVKKTTGITNDQKIL